MAIRIEKVAASSILSRASGYLETVCSHSLQPYVGCSFGNSLCGVGCYVQHNYFLTRGREWGSFLTAKMNAADLYRLQFAREQTWARRIKDRFAIFMSSSTDPFVPQEKKLGITRRVLMAMLAHPPDVLIVQTHTDSILAASSLLQDLSSVSDVRVHLSIESDRDRLPGLPPPACSVAARFDAARRLKKIGLRVHVTVSPLLPIEHPQHFFEKIAHCADAVILDHFIEGDGSCAGSRTLKTNLPAAMEKVEPGSAKLDYRQHMIDVAQTVMPGRVGVGISGFAGKFIVVQK